MQEEEEEGEEKRQGEREGGSRSLSALHCFWPTGVESVSQSAGKPLSHSSAGAQCSR